MATRECPQCGTPIVGRIDKKFCSDQCRFLYNNRQKRESEITIGNVNQALRKNRSILKTLNPIGLTEVRREVMVKMGYNFHFFTHVYRTQKGGVYYFCYEYGYTFVKENDKVKLVTWQDYMPKEVSDVLYQNRFDSPAE
ncbi:Uncharacterized protein containing a Zn-ribbon [Catalinimonas alkaloidigena]|uniref:Uncharacterized protein containing a Zn-ribbon n=1 Tax=Catalinimonas alkaloidigena TaxID=1075417 RepID=A0A1G9S5U4_9BACT|nr:DUF2116 family Zn-ribbon domain-containing protein [Catalinimonas alkaloidigena]SDM30879.1 Uncharacterized protein containing a Zn-ribbon [Catalinimonas alkaloidigena]